MVNQLEVLKADIRDATLPERDADPVADGAARMRLDMVALTANTVTYAVVGEQIGYWRFWPCADPARGIVPAWGFATCVESRSEAVPVGERFYGCWALAETLDVVAKATTAGFVDVAPRREGLAPLYARYERVDAGDSDAEARRALLQPLMATGWLLCDYIAAHDRFGAARVILSAASSKTAIGLAGELKSAGIPALGLTSAGNAAFVTSLGLYDSVLTYDTLPDALDIKTSVFVDMAGSALVRRAVHERLAGGALARSIAVGAAHWQDIAAAPDLPEPRPEFFFAPAWSEKRIADWGAETLMQRMGAGMARHIAQSLDWLDVDRRKGSDLVAAWAEAADGKQDPAKGTIIVF